MPKGLFIALEGIDGSGTTTQAALLAKRLSDLGVPPVSTREPGGTPLGDRLRALLLDPVSNIDPVAEVLLYAAARAQHVNDLILPALAAGRVVISDRFIDSSLAYQAYGRGLGVEMVWRANHFLIDRCLPDITLCLDLTVPLARARRQARGDRPDRIELCGDLFQERVRHGYLALTRAPGANKVLIPADRPVEETAQDLWDAIRPLGGWAG